MYAAGGKIHTLGPKGVLKDIVKFKARLDLSRTSYQRKRPEIPRAWRKISCQRNLSPCFFSGWKKDGVCCSW
jgi:hypothetical protein